jgi:hypothetical protein
MRERLLAWQWSLYPDGHRDRRNLAIHITTVPLFMVGTLTVVSAPWTSVWALLAGLAMMAFAVGAQGRGHRLESVEPVPFAGPIDVVSRLFLEQWVTFPRYVFSGGFGRAWRDSVTGRGTTSAPPRT